ncbi:MAG: hydroxyethylthiazole kinase [Lentisphaeria bacterium]|nr:hydroxyethylthiazole kinase [Lentisphaeria bacterium]
MKLPQQIAETFGMIRQKSPLVHHLTNVVTVNDCANAVLAVGASPVMAPCVREAADMARHAAAVVLNIGTPDELSEAAMLAAGRAANACGIPVVLDPVGVGATPFRHELVSTLLRELQVAIIRGNLAELQCIAGDHDTTATRGVDSMAAESSSTANVARRVASRYHCIAAITGAVDYVSDGERLVAMCNGHILMRQVTGTGCMATSLCAACIGAAPDRPLLAACAGVAAISIAGEFAYAALHGGEGTGTYRQRIIDALSTLTPSRMENSLQLNNAGGNSHLS